jgi:DNA-directed RNA polymerase III subunit RPC5
MRPQFHHIDATTQLEKAKHRRDRDTGEISRTTEPRAVQMSSKPLEGENIDLETIHKFLECAEVESWTKLRYYDEDVR